MLTVENLPIIIIISILLWNFKAILSTIIISQEEFTYPPMTPIEKEDILEDVELIVDPYKSFLISKGFVQEHTLLYDSPKVGLELDHHIYYFFNEEKSIHAYIYTMPEKGSPATAFIRYDSYYKNKKITSTTDGIKYAYPYEFDDIYHFDYYYNSFEKTYESHLKDREIGEEIDETVLSIEGHIAYENYISSIVVDALVNRGVVSKAESSYRYKLSWATFKYMQEIIKSYNKSNKSFVNSSNQSDSKYSIGQANAILGQLRAKKAPSTQKSKLKWFFITMIISVLLLIPFDFPLIDIAIIMVILIIHELGHFLAMRYFGYSDTNIFFIPLFGAAATGTKKKTTALQEYIIYLAGPLPGIVLGVGIGIYLLMAGVEYDSSILAQYALLSVIINYFNLLPIFPLDGGRVVQTMLLLRYPKAQFIFYLASLGLIILSVFWLQSFFAVIFALAIIFMFKSSYLLSTLLEKLLSTYEIEEIDDRRVAETLSSDEKYSQVPLANKVSIATQAIRIINAGKPSKLLMVFGLAFYLLLLTPPIFVVGFVLNKSEVREESVEIYLDDEIPVNLLNNSK